MSYPYPFKQSEYTRENADSYLRWRFPKDVLSPEKHYSWDTFAPHFCGKCNLQLRGWNIRAAGVPDNAPAILPPVVKPPVTNIPIVRILTAIGCIADSTNPSLGTANAIGVSYYPADLAGSQSEKYGKFAFTGLRPFPAGFGDDPEAEKDPAAFRIEVEDLDTAAGSVSIMIEALKPVYSAAGRPTAAATEFPEPERSKRCLVGVECQLVSPNLYRSRYIRLVTDEVDRIALSATKQGLLVTDSADGLGGENDLLEILDQQVRVTYDPTPV